MRVLAEEDELEKTSINSDKEKKIPEIKVIGPMPVDSKPLVEEKIIKKIINPTLGDLNDLDLDYLNKKSKKIKKKHKKHKKDKEKKEKKSKKNKKDKKDKKHKKDKTDKTDKNDKTDKEVSSENFILSSD